MTPSHQQPFPWGLSLVHEQPNIQRNRHHQVPGSCGADSSVPELLVSHSWQLDSYEHHQVCPYTQIFAEIAAFFGMVTPHPYHPVSFVSLKQDPSTFQCSSRGSPQHSEFGRLGVVGQGTQLIQVLTGSGDMSLLDTILQRFWSPSMRR